MSITRNTLALAGVCAVASLGLLGAQQPPAAAGAVAVVKLSPASGSNARGEVTFTQQDKGVQVVGNFTGLHMGEHAFHIHEKGDCSAPDATSAGGHFNPTSKPHGARDAAERHVGDLGNFKVDPYGMGRVNFVDQTLSLSGPNSIVGKAVIVHEKADDFTTQPTGNAGVQLVTACVRQFSGSRSPRRPWRPARGARTIGSSRAPRPSATSWRARSCASTPARAR
jgi:superoxide dismutase, Cu-Zn family